MRTLKGYTDRKPLAHKSICNGLGLVIMDVINGIDTYIVSGFIDGDGIKNVTRSKVKYTVSGRDYFIKNGIRYHLDEFMRCRL